LTPRPELMVPWTAVRSAQREARGMLRAFEKYAKAGARTQREAMRSANVHRHDGARLATLSLFELDRLRVRARRVETKR
jgi:hypothetical protein